MARILTRVEKADVLERIHRYTALRAAQRALEPSAPGRGRLPTPDQVRVVRERLTELGKAGDTFNSTAVLAEIDAHLDLIANRLLSALDSVELAQLRATLPGTCERASSEVVALLDLVLSIERGRADRSAVVEYVLTLLCSESCEGVRRLICDPTELSPSVARYCEQVASANPASIDPKEFVEAFEGATHWVQRHGELEPIVSKTRKLKRRIGEVLFVPEVLRAAIEYNLAVWNCREDMLDRTRTDDFIAEAALISSVKGEFLEDDVEDVAPETLPKVEIGLEEAVSPEQRLIRQAAGLERLEHLLVSHVRGELEVGAVPLPDSVLALNEREKRAFSDGGNEVDELFRSVVATGVAIQALPEAADYLASLGIESELLKADWVRSINEHVRDATKRLVAVGNYGEARALSDCKQRFLSASLTDLVRERARTVPAEGVVSRSTAIAPEFEERRAPRVRDRLPGTRRQQRWVTAVLCAVFLVAIGLRFAIVRPRPIEFFETERLAPISSYVETGYRKSTGSGRLFIGTVARSWNELDTGEQRAEGEQFARRLATLGVREVVLFSSDRKLRFHFADGRVRHPASSK